MIKTPLTNPVDSAAAETTCTIDAASYDLAATLISGQAFRWQQVGSSWEGAICSKWVRLKELDSKIIATTCTPTKDWRWLKDYLQTSVKLDTVVSTFPKDVPMRRAVEACFGLRLLKQDPWECLASFILSSTKQIVQIRQVVTRLCERYGEPVNARSSVQNWHSFPCAETVAGLNERDLRDCGMGFRAPYLLKSARLINDGSVSLNTLVEMELNEAREHVMRLPGVGRKIADCVLLFTGSQPAAFPVDVWVMKALQQLYFPNQPKTLRQLQMFSETYFGPNAGYAQQYLFHYMRVHRIHTNS